MPGGRRAKLNLIDQKGGNEKKKKTRVADAKIVFVYIHIFIISTGPRKGWGVI